MSDSERHIVVVSLPFWGHVRGMLCFCATLLQVEKGLYITFFVHGTYWDKTQALYTSIGMSSDSQSRIHFVTVGSHEAAADPLAPFYEVPQGVISTYYENLIRGEAIADFKALPPPVCLICDFFSHGVLDHARHAGYDGKKFTFIVTDPANQVAKFLEHSVANEDTLIHVDSLPPLYRYEMFPCSKLFPREAVRAIEIPANESQLTGNDCLVVWSRRFHPDSPVALQKALDESGGKVFVVEPQYQADFWRPAATFPETDPIFAWLNKQAKQSVIYVSFGTLFFPTLNPWQIDALVDALIACKQKFVFCMAAAMAAALPAEKTKEIQERITQSGNISTGWIDQLLLLRHGAVSFVLSHGGANSTLECLIHGIPLIIWPFGAEQAPSAAYLTLKADVAFELLEVRDLIKDRTPANYPGCSIQCTPASVRKEFDSVLEQARGSEGARKRANAQRIGQMLREEHEENGESYAREFLALM